MSEYEIRSVGGHVEVYTRGGVFLFSADTEREQPLYLPQSGLYAHYDTQARTDQESICGNGASDRRE